jgi:hypothetical protein
VRRVCCNVLVPGKPPPPCPCRVPFSTHNPVVSYTRYSQQPLLPSSTSLGFATRALLQGRHTVKPGQQSIEGSGQGSIRSNRADIGGCGHGCGVALQRHSANYAGGAAHKRTRLPPADTRYPRFIHTKRRTVRARARLSRDFRLPYAASDFRLPTSTRTGASAGCQHQHQRQRACHTAVRAAHGTEHRAPVATIGIWQIPSPVRHKRRVRVYA